MQKRPETGIKYFRDTSINPIQSQAEGAEDVFTFSWSSEYPVDMYFYKEILSHDEGCMNLERLAGMNLLWNHDRNIVLGKIQRVWVENKKAYCEARWSKKPSIAEHKQDVTDGIVTNASFLYSVEKYEEIEEIGKEDCIFLALRWTPYEISLVSVPADPTVGVGRSVSESIIKENPRVIMEKTALDIRNEELQRTREISAMGEKFRMPELARGLIEDGTELSIARKTFLDKMENYQKPVAKAIDTSLDLSDKEQRQYSLVRAINAVAFGMTKDAGFEMECSNEIAKKLGRPTNGFFMPVRDLRVKANLQQRATYAVGANATGGFTVQTDLLEQEFIDLLRNRAMVMQLGASMISGLVGNVDIPGQATAATSYWIGEGNDLTQSEGTFKQIPLRMKTVGALSRYTRTMMMQSSIDIESFIRNDFARIIALAIDTAAISGTGLSNQPRGILNTTGVGSIALGAAGGQPTWGSIVGLIREIEIDNANLGGTAWLTNPQVMSKLMTTPIQSGGLEGNFLLKEPGNTLCGYPFYVTNQIPANLTKSTGTNLSALILGNWPQLLIGEWGVFEVLANPYSSNVFPSGSVEVRCMQSIDINIRNPESFAVITDMITTL
jgi:HK97 family phage major capsid protein/HK97 family phage prohead protease